MKDFDFKLVTQEGLVVEEEVREVTLPTPEGELTILADHMPLVGLVEAGELRIGKKDGDVFMAATGGFFKVADNRLAILADSAVRSDELDEKKAEEARAKAEDLMRRKLDERERAETEAALQKALLHIKVARKRARRGPGAGIIENQ